MKAIIHRLRQDEKQTQGIFLLYNNEIDLLFACNSLELDWQGNQQNISCIPKGEYKVRPRTSDQYGEHFIISDVPNRDLILFHWGNYFRDTKGCILLGDGFTNLDGDGILDILSSKNAIRNLNSHTNRKGFKLKIL